MIGLFTIILPFLLLSKEYMVDGGMNIYTPSRGFGKRNPVLQEEGIPNSVQSKWILPIELHQQIIKILNKDEKRRHRMNIFLHRIS